MSLITGIDSQKKKHSSTPQMILLGEKEISSLIYHDIFDYPLTPLELINWTAGEKVRFKNIEDIQVSTKNGFLFLKGKEGSTLKRLMKSRISKRKIAKAHKAAKILSLLPTVKMVGITGALAMDNASEDSDIDVMVITKKGSLWTTRLLSILLLTTMRIPRRKYGDKESKDKLCLNIWLDEDDLGWKKKNRNIFSAHEICQIIPLVNKNETFERFLNKNSWARDYWPNAISTKTEEKGESMLKEPGALMRIIEPLVRKAQYEYMKNKMTREIVTATRALFHPVDWAALVSSKLGVYLG